MQNFGEIKNIFNSLLVEAITTNNENKRKLFQEYVRAIKGNEILKTEFLIYNNIEEKVEMNEQKATMFVHENINILNKYSKKEILEANKILSSKLLKENKLPLTDNKLSNLHNDISNLIFTKKSTKSIDSIIESTTNIVDYIKNNKINEVNEVNPLPNSILSNIVVDKFNDRYCDLSEDEKKVLKTILKSNEEDKVKLYETITRECIDLVDINLIESDIDAREKLLTVKDRLLRSKYNTNTFINEISKLVELKTNLK